ncbi:MAG: 4Fe-4S dicluster domain-containing protein [Coriobacteriales bacterium]|jgi:ferredoxin-type protein NapG
MANNDGDQGRAPAVSRRGFVYGACGIVGLFALGGIGKVAYADETLLRPPGGQDESAFMSACLKCDKCRSICPENCIVAGTIEDGLVNYRAPKLNFHRGYCTFCNECIEVCPLGALASFDPASQKIGVARIDSDECIAYKLGGGCSVCVDTCPYRAISLDASGRPVVDETLCNGCGKCEHECPSASLGSYSGSRIRGINVEKA